MKKALLFLCGTFLRFNFMTLYSYSYLNVGTNYYTNMKCNQRFDPIKLRYGDSYIFGDKYMNNSNQNKNLVSASIDVYEPYDYNSGYLVGNFDFSDEINAQEGVLYAKKAVKIIKGVDEYKIAGVPPKRAKDNLVIQYKIRTSLNGVIGPEHTECQPYEITRCGDGVIDSDEGEKCDDGANNGKPGYCGFDCKGQTPICGNGIVESGEECDDGNKNNFDSCTNSCNIVNDCKYINGGRLRYGSGYTFSHHFSHQISDKIRLFDMYVTPTVDATYNGTDSFVKFEATPEIIKKDYVINSGEKIDILKTNTTYDIEYHAPRKSNNIFLKYTVGYHPWSEYAGGFDGTKFYVQNTCANYEVTRCGDGIVDRYEENGNNIYEECDDGVNNGKPGYCGLDCRQNTTPTPTCTNLNVSPASGRAPTTSTFTCNGTNSNDYVIQVFDSSNRLLRTISDSNGSYNFATNGNYRVTCSVGGQTSPSCTQNVSITPTETPTNHYDLALTKTVSSAGPFRVGDVVTFDVTVYNQGTIDAHNIEVTDYIPNNLELVSTDWTKNAAGNLATHVISSIPAGTHRTVPVQFRIRSGTNGEMITNRAEISRDDGNDCDSTPDQNQSNDGYTTDNLIGNGCDDTNGDEDDHDPASITINSTDTSPRPSINIDKTDANPADLDKNIGNDTQTVNRGEKAVFKITVRNDGNEDLRNIVLTDAQAPNCAGPLNFATKRVGSNPVTFAGNGNHNDDILQVGETFSYTCEKENTTASYTNTAGVSGDGVTSGRTVTDSDASAVRIPGGGTNPTFCGDGTVQKPNDEGLIEECDAGNDNLKPEEYAAGKAGCYACKITNYSPDIPGGGGGGTYCGDGIVQKPNDDGVMETCDPKDPDRKGRRDNACPATCKFNSCSATGICEVGNCGPLHGKPIKADQFHLFQDPASNHSQFCKSVDDPLSLYKDSYNPSKKIFNWSCGISDCYAGLELPKGIIKVYGSFNFCPTCEWFTPGVEEIGNVKIGYINTDLTDKYTRSIMQGDYLPFGWIVPDAGKYINVCGQGLEGYYKKDSLLVQFEINGTKVKSDEFNGFNVGIKAFSGDNSVNGQGHIKADFTKNLKLGKNTITGKIVNRDVCTKVGEKYKWIADSAASNSNFATIDFTVTKPYLIQKDSPLTSFNNTNISFHDNDGKPKTLGQYGVKAPNKVNSNQNADINTVVNNFVNRYSAYTILPSHLFGESVKKAPTQNVYYLSLGESLNIGNESFNRPTTLIVDAQNHDVIINGDIRGPFMLVVKNGNIVISNKGTSLEQVRVLEGYYITNKEIEVDNSNILNTNPDSSTWHSDGRLVVRGVIVGKNADKLYEGRRSLLKSWFGEGPNYAVQNGASLTIESNPSLWTNPPVGSKNLFEMIKIQKGQ